MTRRIGVALGLLIALAGCGVSHDPEVKSRPSAVEDLNGSLRPCIEFYERAPGDDVWELVDVVCDLDGKVSK